MAEKFIGVVIADGCEYEPMRDFALGNGGKSGSLGGMECVRFAHGHDSITAVRCGIGKVNAASAAAFLIADGARMLISTGYSGGICGVSRGMTAVATRFLEHDFDLTPLGYDRAVKPEQQYVYDASGDFNAAATALYPEIASGVMVTGDCFVCDDERRDWLRDSFGAIACDMESAAVASVAFRCGVGAAALRRISDDAGKDAHALYSASAVYETSMTDMLLAIIDRMAEVE